MKSIIWQHYPALDSTQTAAVKFVEHNVIDCPVLISTDMQTAGYGTHNRIWVSQTGNLLATFSIKQESCNFAQCKTDIKESDALTCARIMQIAVKQLVDVELDLKEPNDLMLGNKKCCGIMINKMEDLEGKAILCIGIGFNCAKSVDTNQATTFVKCDKTKLMFKWIDVFNENVTAL